jgi:hypothetical protein
MSELELVAPEKPRPKIVAITLTAIGFGLALAAQYLPWASLNLNAAGRLTDGEDGGAAAKTIDMPVAYFNVAHMTVYLLTLGFGLAALATVLAAQGPVRRAATGAGFGLFGANLVTLVGLKGVIDHVGSTSLAALDLDSDMVSSGPGYFLAYAAVLVLAAALVLAAWTPTAGLRIRRRVEEPEGDEPLELTVTPVPQSFQ